MRNTPGLRVKMVGQPMLSAIAALPATFAEVIVVSHPGLLRVHSRLSAHQHLGQDGIGPEPRPVGQSCGQLSEGGNPRRPVHDGGLRVVSAFKKLLLTVTNFDSLGGERYARQTATTTRS